jgi:hypothetical protein
MSNEIAILLSAIIGALAGYSVAMLNRKDKFKLLLFEKRLEVHQKAYSYLYKVWFDMLVDSQEERNKAKQWYIENCFYLDPQSKKSFHRFLGNIVIVGGLSTEKAKNEQIIKCEDLLEETAKNLTLGINAPWYKEEIEFLKKQISEQKDVK